MTGVKKCTIEFCVNFVDSDIAKEQQGMCGRRLELANIAGEGDSAGIAKVPPKSTKV